MELGYSRFLNQDMASQFVNVGCGWRILIEVSVFICVCVVDIVADSEKFLRLTSLLIVIGASQKNGSDTDDIVLRKLRNVWACSLKIKN